MSIYDAPMREAVAQYRGGGGWRAVLDRCLAFWFKPANLTTLGAIRICAGLLFTYILVVYCYDLYELLGKDAWVDSEMMNQLRHDQPWWRESDQWIDDRAKPLPNDPAEKARLNRYFNDWEWD